MASSVEVDGLLQSNLSDHVIGGDSLLQLLGGSIEVVHVGLVVLGVMDLHDLGGDLGLEGLG